MAPLEGSGDPLEGSKSLYLVCRSAPLRKQLKRKARQLAREHNRSVLVARGEEDELEVADYELEEDDVSS